MYTLKLNLWWPLGKGWWSIGNWNLVTFSYPFSSQIAAKQTETCAIDLLSWKIQKHWAGAVPGIENRSYTLCSYVQLRKITASHKHSCWVIFRVFVEVCLSFFFFRAAVLFPNLTSFWFSGLADICGMSRKAETCPFSPVTGIFSIDRGWNAMLHGLTIRHEKNSSLKTWGFKLLWNGDFTQRHMEDFDGLQAMLIRSSRSLIVAPPMLGSLQDEGPGAVGGAYATYLKKYMFEVHVV